MIIYGLVAFSETPYKLKLNLRLRQRKFSNNDYVPVFYFLDCMGYKVSRDSKEKSYN